MSTNSDQNKFNLTGSFLVATTEMPDPRFSNYVIYICAHDAEGALGVAINQPDKALNVDMLLAELNMSGVESVPRPVYVGGPVSPESAFILYKNFTYLGEKIDVTDTVFLSREKELLSSIATGVGPEDYIIILGYTGWGPNQLEQEVTSNGWLVLPGSEDIIFSTADEKKWAKSAQLYGIDITTFSDKLGFA
ncbi:MAG: YqgE/AlgH family protein [Desulfotalea sp.]